MPPIHAASANRWSAFDGTAIVGSNAYECPTAALATIGGAARISASPGRRASASAQSGGSASSVRHSSTRPTFVANADAIQKKQTEGLKLQQDLQARQQEFQAALSQAQQEKQGPIVAELEDELYGLLNETGIGPMGLGGDVTVLQVHVEHADTHMTLNPVAVNYQCWAARRASARIAADGATDYDRDA